MTHRLHVREALHAHWAAGLVVLLHLLEAVLMQRVPASED